MKNEVVREDSESTQRRTWSAAEAAAFPALGIHPGKTPEALSREPRALSRVPRASVAPPSSETVITPAPQFAEDVSIAPAAAKPAGEDLDGIVELSSSMLEDADDTGVHKIEMLSDDLVEAVDDDIHELSEHELSEQELSDAEVIEEVDSGLLAYVETRGEISEKHHAVPAPNDVSKVSLATLHESLHTQAVASGMLTYSNGVPIHDLESGTSASRTLQIHRPATAARNKLVKNLLIGSVFLAGIGAGVYFGLPSKSAPAVVQEPTAVVPATAAAAVVQDESPAPTASANAVAAQAAALPTVAPLVESGDVESGDVESGDSEEEPVAATAPEVTPLGAGDVQVQPLTETEESEAPVPAEPEMVVRPLEVKSLDTDVAEKVAKPSKKKVSRKARSNDTKDLAPRTLGTSATGDPGVLMLAAKPPCDILIDGKKTGLKTPQRVLRLPPGKHRVTLLNREHNLKDSFRVSIKSGEKTRVVRDMTSKIK